ncbi:hypothetical protein B0T16DRAFT_394436 [Cercophora newfieldiana]|uniref:Ca3427-like PBP 2 domain-containing protein n=1 Tax=Cercophora newfieldiana TaxID=92897 RepID=A0AA40CHJ4_9PEZI|nr:hypothetical protein B0T16DRAFT_394436 [Cercophora newfieldiana]
MSAPLKIGYVPEHFSTPIHFAKKYYGLDAELIAFPSGTGHMITALRAGDIDIGIGLTEGWVAGLGKPAFEIGDGGYRLVGTYVETPLCWAISTGAARPEITSVDSLKGSKIGVSRIGSGSYVMGYVLAEERGWLIPTVAIGNAVDSAAPYSEFKVLNTFENLRRAVNSGEADFFMWEHFTSKRYYDSGEIRRVGEIYTPWSSWKVVASTKLVKGDGEVDARVEDVLEKLNKGIEHFNGNQEEAVKYISTELDYSEEDAREWLKTVKFPERTQGVDLKAVERTVVILQKAGVLTTGVGAKPEEMVVKSR